MNVLDVLDIDADRNGDSDSVDIDSSDDTMPRQKPLTKSVRELQRTEKEGKCAGNSVRQ